MIILFPLQPLQEYDKSKLKLTEGYQKILRICTLTRSDSTNLAPCFQSQSRKKILCLEVEGQKAYSDRW